MNKITIKRLRELLETIPKEYDHYQIIAGNPDFSAGCDDIVLMEDNEVLKFEFPDRGMLDGKEW